MNATPRYLDGVQIVDSTSYFDTVVIFKRTYATADQLQTMREHSAYAFPELITSKNGIHRGTKWTLHRPTQILLEMLQADPRTSITAVHIALDLCTSSREDGDRLHESLRGSLVLANKPGLPLTDFEGTSYLPWLEGKQNLRGRQFVIYSDRPSKVNGSACCHIELRVKGKKGVESYGLNTLTSLLHLDFTLFWDRYFDVRDNPMDETLQLAHVACRKKYIRAVARAGSPVQRQTAAELEEDAIAATRLLRRWSFPWDREERGVDCAAPGPTDIFRGLARCRIWAHQVRTSDLPKKRIQSFLPPPRNALWEDELSFQGVR